MTGGDPEASKIRALEAPVAAGETGPTPLWRLAARLAHVLNNRLAVVVGAATLAREELRGGFSRERIDQELEDVLQASHEASDTIRRLLSYGRARTVRPREMDLAAWLLARRGRLRTVLPEPRRLMLEVPGRCLIEADPELLEEVLVELVANAAAATRESGAVTVRVDARRDGRPGARLVVADDGMGMTDVERELAVEPFHSSSPSLKAGLGLAAVVGLVELMGGVLTLESDLGGGTRVEIELSGPAAAAGTQPRGEE